MKKIEFLGGSGGEVTGSCYVLTSDDDQQALVDFGMFQGKPDIVKRNYDLLGFRPSALKAVFVTHAHLDHTGRLPLLVFGGFAGKIYMTKPTKAFVEIILHDSARIAEKDMTHEPLYTIDEVGKVLEMIELVEYDTPVIAGSFQATFRDAGHILGAASIEIIDQSNPSKQKIVFSGDLGNTPQDIVKPTEYVHSGDIVVMESTYGDSLHPKEDPAQIIQNEINEVEKSGGVLLIPSFALERTQEVLHIIHHLKKDGKIRADTPVFLDSPMGIDATSVYLDFKKYCNSEIQGHTDYPFNFEGLVIINDAKESKEIIEEPGPKVIIAGSGMMSGGRIMHHAQNYLEYDNTRLLFVGYQGEETTGREILEGKPSVMIQKSRIPVRAKITEIKTLSSHADQPKLLNWLSQIKGVKKVFLTHGDQLQREALAEKIKTDLGIKDVILPEHEQAFDLP